jgi:hypothetical protein
MKTLKIGFTFFLLILFQESFAQGKVTMYKTFGGAIYFLNDSIEMSPKQTKMVLFSNQRAYSEFKKARFRSFLSLCSGVAGSICIAVPLVTAAVGEKPDWILLLGGVTGIGGGLILNSVYRARALYAIDLYNASLPQKTSRIKPEFYFYGTGARLVIKF